MSSFSHLIDEEESEAVKETRAVAQTQFVDLSQRYVKLSEELKEAKEREARYRAAYASASRRAGELSTLLAEELPE